MFLAADKLRENVIQTAERNPEAEQQQQQLPPPPPPSTARHFLENVGVEMGVAVAVVPVDYQPSYPPEVIEIPPTSPAENTRYHDIPDIHRWIPTSVYLNLLPRFTFFEQMIDHLVSTGFFRTRCL